jgi:hypothetical protein
MDRGIGSGSVRYNCRMMRSNEYFNIQKSTFSIQSSDFEGKFEV